MVVHLNQTQGTIEYNGHSAEIVSESSAYITVVTEDGERVSVPKNSALLSFGNKDELDELLENNQQKIKEYNRAWNIAKDEKNSYISQIGAFWRNLNLTSGSYDRLNHEQSAQISFLKESKYDAISAMHRASAGVHSTVLDSLSAITSFRAMI